MIAAAATRRCPAIRRRATACASSPTRARRRSRSTPTRLNTNRGNAYLPPGTLNGFASAKNGIFPNFDCKNTDYTPASQDQDEDEIVNGESVSGINSGNPPSASFAPCYIQDAFPNSSFGNFGDERFPQLFQDP